MGTQISRIEAPQWYAVAPSENTVLPLDITPIPDPRRLLGLVRRAFAPRSSTLRPDCIAGMSRRAAPNSHPRPNTRSSRQSELCCAVYQVDSTLSIHI